MSLLPLTRLLRVSADSLEAINRKCACIKSLASIIVSRQSHSQATDSDNNPEQLSPNDDVNPNFINRNPRNLESMGIGKKRKGWGLQYPTKEFYHRLLFQSSNRNTQATLEHSNGSVVVSASTEEMAIAKHLYSKNDVAAAENIGHIISRRCLESGISCMILHEPEHGEKSEKFIAFKNAVEDGGVDLREPEEVIPNYEPGINYNDPEEVHSLRTRQARVHNIGDYHRRALITKKNIYGGDKARRWRLKRKPMPTLEEVTDS